MSSTPLGPLLLIIGGLLVLAGLLVWSGALDWFGRLPGDIRIERGHSRVYIPIVSMLLISAALSAIVHLLRRFFREF